MVRFTTQNFDPFLRSSIGFDNLFTQIADVNSTKTQNYPPYNIIKKSDENYVIELAVSGFSINDLMIELKENILKVTGEKDEMDRDYIHKGIGARSFERKFTLAADLVVQDAEIIDGILVINLELIIPDHKKARTIDIGQPKKSKKKQFLTE